MAKPLPLYEAPSVSKARQDVFAGDAILVCHLVAGHATAKFADDDLDRHAGASITGLPKLISESTMTRGASWTLICASVFLPHKRHRTLHRLLTTCGTDKGPAE